MPLIDRQGRVARRSFMAAAVTLAVLVAAPARGLQIIPTFDSSITNDPNAATIEATINSAVSYYSVHFSDPITVNITFQEGGGLGSSSTYYSVVSYSSYHAALVADGKSADDATALLTLPSGSNNPVNGSTSMDVTLPALRAVGLSSYVPPAGQPDGFITLNTSLMNLSRSGTIDPNKYDLMAVAQHEIDEVLGLGSSLNGGSAPSPEDLFRYSAPGVRSYSASAPSSYFSINGGTTNLVNFNQTNDGSDFGDWASSSTPRVQDAYGTPGAQPNLGIELVALDVIGYDRVVPEPASASLLALGALALGALARRRARRSAEGA